MKYNKVILQWILVALVVLVLSVESNTKVVQAKSSTEIDGKEPFCMYVFNTKTDVVKTFVAQLSPITMIDFGVYRDYIPFSVNTTLTFVVDMANGRIAMAYIRTNLPETTPTKCTELYNSVVKPNILIIQNSPVPTNTPSTPSNK